MVGVVVEIPLAEDADIETVEGIEALANNKQVSDALAALISGALAHNYSTGEEFKIWASRVVTSVEGLWEQCNG